MIAGRLGLALIASAVAVGATLAPAAAAETMRVCADPDNLPFSRAEGPERGFYLELAELVGQRMHVDIEYVWWLTYYQKRALRNTLLANQCEAYFALPADESYMGKSIGRTRPFLELSYAIVAPRSFAFSNANDLKGKRIAVQYGSPPQIFLADQTDMQVTTFRTADEVFDALAKREVDAAFMWGPIAGYENKKRFNDTYQVIPVRGYGMEGQIAVGVKKGNEDLVARIERALAELSPDIVRLERKYGFPSAAAVDIAPAGKPAPAAAVPKANPPPEKVAGGSSVSAAAAQPEPSQSASGNESDLTGRQLFNNLCSHCHSPNGASPEPKRDLRRLSMRYGDQWRNIAVQTIKSGRPADGMPPWNDALDEKRIGTIVTFFESIQRQP